MPALVSTLQSVLFTVAAKAVGSIFRYFDDRQANAPKEVLNNTAKREGILVLLTSVFTWATQFAFDRKLTSVVMRNPKLAPYSLLLNALAGCIGIGMAEATSRIIAPTAKNRYGTVSLAPNGPHHDHIPGHKNYDDDDDDRGHYRKTPMHRPRLDLYSLSSFSLPGLASSARHQQSPRLLSAPLTFANLPKPAAPKPLSSASSPFASTAKLSMPGRTIFG